MESAIERYRREESDTKEVTEGNRFSEEEAAYAQYLDLYSKGLTDKILELMREEGYVDLDGFKHFLLTEIKQGLKNF